MGTTFSIEIRDAGDWGAALVETVAWLHHVDAVFSTYRTDSDISRLGRGEMELGSADVAVGDVFALCAEVARETDGWFTPRWNGGAALDPTGLVKGWAIERAGEILRRHGSVNHAVNGGGDIQLAGCAAPGQPWRIGISDPSDRGRTVALVTGTDLAVATSGVAERGAHIVDPFTGLAAAGLASVTVTGASLTRVDAYATAAFAMGGSALGWLEQRHGCEGFVVRLDGSVGRTSGFPG